MPERQFDTMSRPSAMMTPNPIGDPRRVLVHCIQCDRMISRETAHRCSLPADYRAQRDTIRRRKHAELDTLTIRQVQGD